MLEKSVTQVYQEISLSFSFLFLHTNLFYWSWYCTEINRNKTKKGRKNNINSQVYVHVCRYGRHMGGWRKKSMLIFILISWQAALKKSLSLFFPGDSSQYFALHHQRRPQCLCICCKKNKIEITQVWMENWIH